MAPLPVLDNESLGRQFDSTAIGNNLQHATALISSSMRFGILILAGLTTTAAAVYYLHRLRNGPGSLVCPATPLMVYDSTISIDFEETADDDDCTFGSDGRRSFETIISMTTPTKLTFDIGGIMPFLSRRAGGILDRRGQATLKCDTTAYYETDVLLMATRQAHSPIDRKACRAQVDFVEDVGSPLTPFWARQAAALSPRGRSMFGFGAEKNALRSPTWSRRAVVRLTPKSSWDGRPCQTP
ncbi:uncharacterized protein LTR77_005210 [Saxophila tyrrhenica]|uniref:Uncharacterized protein n=1 Tax=Saxophila tyrrhenica TaxID=1690608 RepID=A0AAV9PBS0_9PEZI|nr:hypothetical protein LTR77_005210 [Saxophila tyrrhenica]